MVGAGSLRPLGRGSYHCLSFDGRCRRHIFSKIHERIWHFNDDGGITVPLTLPGANCVSIKVGVLRLHMSR
jgi:hypothetical protein